MVTCRERESRQEEPLARAVGEPLERAVGEPLESRWRAVTESRWRAVREQEVADGGHRARQRGR